MFPRFSLRAVLVVFTLAACVSILLGAGEYGKEFAVGVLIALATLLVSLLMHAFFFAATWLVGRLYQETDFSKYTVTVEPVYTEASVEKAAAGTSADVRQQSHHQQHEE